LRLANSLSWPHVKVVAVRLLNFMSKGGHPLSSSLHDQFTNWLLPGASPSAAGAARRGGAATLPATQARLLLRAWVGLAAAPGSPARATLPALVQALDARLCAANQLGAAGVVQRAVGARLDAAGRLRAAGACISDMLSVHDAAGEFFNRQHVISVLRRLAKLCALVTRNRLLACMLARAPAPRVTASAARARRTHRGLCAPLHADAAFVGRYKPGANSPGSEPKPERKRVGALVSALQGAVRRHLPEMTGQDVCLAANALGTLRRMEPELLEEMAGAFEAAMLRGDETVRLEEAASFLNTCELWRFRAERSLLSCVRDWVTAAACGGGAGAGPRALGPPASAATLMRVWAHDDEVRAGGELALPMGAVEALTRSAAAGAGADERGGGFAGRKLAVSLHAVASLVRAARKAAPAGGSEQRLVGLDSDIARWAGLAIGHAQPGHPQEARDLGMSVWALGYLGVAPDAATAAAAGAQAAALAAQLPPQRLLLLISMMAGPLAQWHEAGLASCEPAAAALCARAPDLQQQDTARVMELLRRLAAATGVPEPVAPSPAEPAAGVARASEAGIEPAPAEPATAAARAAEAGTEPAPAEPAAAAARAGKAGTEPAPAEPAAAAARPGEAGTLAEACSSSG